jgi:vacuolar-type H+-ATPase subunit F/Vma7
MRLVAMGARALTEGFALLGFETVDDATSDDVEQTLATLLEGHEQALVVIGQALASEPPPSLRRVRREGNHIVVIELPELHSPAEYRPPVEQLVLRVLGVTALEPPP